MLTQKVPFEKTPHWFREFGDNSAWLERYKSLNAHKLLSRLNSLTSITLTTNFGVGGRLVAGISIGLSMKPSSTPSISPFLWYQQLLHSHYVSFR